MQQPPNPLPTIPFDPLEDRVVILPLDAESTTKGGIVIPDTAKDKPVKGVVLAAGPGKFRERPMGHLPMPVRRGDLVVYPMWAGEKFPQSLGEKDLRILRASEVLGIMNRDTKPENVPVDLVEVQS